jgi:metallophosphoesterase (TIGR00282 family)
MRILYIAELVGKAGVFAVKQKLAEVKKQKRVDFVIANADSATGGRGLGKGHAVYLHKLGIQAITLGEYCFYKKDLVENIEKMPYILRPANFTIEAPGCGSRVYKAGCEKIAVASLIGQSGFSRLHGDSPTAALPLLVERLRRETDHIFIDFHANTTAEKRVLFAVADGLCSAVIGSHTRVQTADENALAKGTAVITDAGRTGSLDSVGGEDAETRVREYLTGIPEWTKEAWANIELQGVIVETDKNGKAVSIERLRCPVKTEEKEETSE